MTVSIERATSEHLPEIAALAERVWRAHYPGIISHAQIEYMLARMYSLDVLRDELAGGIFYHRLLVETRCVGFSACGPGPQAGEMKLHKLYVHPEHQRGGHGSLLLRHVESLARDQGCERLILAVNKRNAAAIAAYVRNGFMIRESIVAGIGGGFVMDDYIMEKRVERTTRM